MSNKKMTPAPTPHVNFFKKYSVLLLIFLLILISCLFFAFRSFNKKPDPALSKVVEPVIESKMVNSPPPSQGKTLLHPTLAAVELVRGVLEGGIPFKTLKETLQKNPEPWAKSLYVNLNTIGDIKTYTELEALITQKTRPPKPSIWKKLKNLVKVEKLNKQDIIKALKEHDIKQALRAFEKLPKKDQDDFKAWKTVAHDRAVAEAFYEKLLINLARETSE